jgi:hypothetical protein
MNNEFVKPRRGGILVEIRNKMFSELRRSEMF